MSERTPAPTRRPVTASVAGIIAIAVGGITVVSGIGGMVRASGTSNPAGVRMAATFMLLLAGLFILVGIRVLQGLNWARVTLTVLLGIALVGAVMGVSNGSGTSMNITTLALAASVLVLLWLPVSSAWFRAQRSS